MLSSKCAVKSRFQVKNQVNQLKKPIFIKQQKASEILSSLGLKAPLIKIPQFGNICLKV